MCLGRTDLPLDTLGRLQAALLGVSLRPAALYSSPLVRARETARPMGEAKILPGLTERFAGDWDGLRFDEIRSRWPELYAARGGDPSLPMPGAEPDSAALARFSAALEAILRETPRGAAAVSHAGVIGLYLESLGLPVENRISLHSLRAVPDPDPSVRVCASEKERLDLLRGLHRQLILADDPSLSVCPPDNVTLRFAMPVTRGAQVARHLPLMGLRGADYIAESVEEYLQMLR